MDGRKGTSKLKVTRGKKFPEVVLIVKSQYFLAERWERASLADLNGTFENAVIP